MSYLFTFMAGYLVCHFGINTIITEAKNLVEKMKNKMSEND